VLSQGGPRDAAVNFDKKNLQQHRAVSVPQHGFPVRLQFYISDRSNDEITHSTLIFTAVARDTAT